MFRKMQNWSVLLDCSNIQSSGHRINIDNDDVITTIPFGN